MKNPIDPAIDARQARRRTWGALASVLLITTATYSMSFDGPFIFDDTTAIVDNEHIRQLWPLTQAMGSPRLSTVAGRPLVSFTLAINYAISGLDSWSYHVMNLLLHLMCAWVFLFLIIRTLSLPSIPGWLRRRAVLVGWLTTLIWAVHPINSETVIYVIQRTELLVALFMLLAFDALRRSSVSERGRIWQLLVVFYVVLGLLCKEVAAVMPLALLLYDRAFLSGSFGRALRARWLMYLVLISTWVLAGWLAAMGHRGGLGGSELAWRYLLTQGGVILMYLRLLFFPYPLAITYHVPLAEGVVDSLPGSLVVLALLATTVYGLFRYPKTAFLGACFFLILAPTSSVIPIMTEVAGERRMYLPGAAVLILVVIWALALLRRCRLRWPRIGAPEPWMAASIVSLSIAAGMATFVRSHDFDTQISIWEQTWRVQPKSKIAMMNLATQYIGDERLEEGERMLRRVERIAPHERKLPMNWGSLFYHRGQYKEAAERYIEASLSDPHHAGTALAYAGLCYGLLGDDEKAHEMYMKALAVDPGNRRARNFMATKHAKRGNPDQTIQILQELLAENEDYGSAHANLAIALDQAGYFDDARRHFQRAASLEPRSLEVLQNYGAFEARHDNLDEAERVLRRALGISPDHRKSLTTLAAVLRQAGRLDESDRIYRPLLDEYPEDAVVRVNYAVLLAARNKFDEAADQLNAALEIDPDHDEAKKGLSFLAKMRESHEKEGSAATP